MNRSRLPSTHARCFRVRRRTHAVRPVRRSARARATGRPGLGCARGLLSRAPDLDPTAIGDVVWGCANQAGEDNRNVGRMAVLLSGLPVSVPATTVNRLCGSSLDAAIIGSRAIESGDADVVVVGGVESMSRAPWVLPKPATAFPVGDVTAVSTTLGWRLVERADAAGVDRLARRGQRAARATSSRSTGSRQDEFAARSHRLADAAWDSGFYDDLVVPVDGADLGRDEAIRPGSTPEKLASLKPSFRADGTITAGNASPLSDGASAVLLGSDAAAEDRRPARPDRRPWRLRAGAADVRLCTCRRGGPRLGPRRNHLGRCRRRGAERGVRGPVARVHRCLGQSTRGSSTPRAVRSRSVTRSGPQVGGSSAPWPHGCGESGERWGVAAICIGVGQALAVVLENVR